MVAINTNINMMSIVVVAHGFKGVSVGGGEGAAHLECFFLGNH